MPPKKNVGAHAAKAKAKSTVVPKAKQSANAKASDRGPAKAKAKAPPGTGAGTMTQITRPDPATGELRNVTLVTPPPPASASDRVVQPLTDYWKSAFKPSDNNEKRQKLSHDRDSEPSNAVSSSVLPPVPPTGSRDEVETQPTGSAPTDPIDEAEEQKLIAELETQIASPPSPSRGREGRPET